MKKYKIDLAVFLCGAIGMMLELVAARVLSPYVGSSNLIWTTIIGVMLISMSIGYSIGGKIADKKPDVNILSFLILLGAFFTSLIPIFETVLVKTMAGITDNLILIALVTATLIFGIPSFIVAITSPFAVKLKDKEKEHKNVGNTSREDIIFINDRKYCRNIFSGFCFNSKPWSKNNYINYNNYIIFNFFYDV